MQCLTLTLWMNTNLKYNDVKGKPSSVSNSIHVFYVIIIYFSTMKTIYFWENSVNKHIERRARVTMQRTIY